MAKTFTFAARIDTTKIAQDTQQIRQLIELAFAPVNFNAPDLSQSAQIQVLRTELAGIANVDLTKPLDELQKELKESEELVKSLEAKLNKRVTQAKPTGERVTALTVTEKSVGNAERLTAALKDAAIAQEKLAEATKQTEASRSNNGLEFERQRLEMARRNAVIVEKLVQKERTSGEEKRQLVLSTTAVQVEASRRATQAARAEANERTQASRTATAEQIEIEKRSTSQFIEEQKRRTSEFKTQLKTQDAAQRQAATEQKKEQKKEQKVSSEGEQNFQKEEALLLILEKQIAAETQRREVALTGIREQITLATRLAEVRLNGEKQVQQVAEKRRQDELALARTKKTPTADIERAHLKERILEQSKLTALTNDYNAKRLQAEKQVEALSSRNTLERIQGEQKIAAAVERVAHARLASAQSALRTANDDGRAAAEYRVAVAIEQVSNAQRERAALQERAVAEAIAAENRIAEATTRAAQERIRAEERVQATRKKTVQQSPSGGGFGSTFRSIESGANLLTGGIAAFATVQLIRQINNTVQELNRLRVESDRSKVSLDILSGSSERAAARIGAIKQAGGGAIATLQATQRYSLQH
jgi:hypothetical protein